MAAVEEEIASAVPTVLAKQNHALKENAPAK
jgi:hypothetical protein